jgi:hypothetical protein
LLPAVAAGGFWAELFDAAPKGCDDGVERFILGTASGPQIGKRRSAGLRRRVGEGTGQMDMIDVFFIQAGSRSV